MRSSEGHVDKYFCHTSIYIKFIWLLSNLRGKFIAKPWKFWSWLWLQK